MCRLLKKVNAGALFVAGLAMVQVSAAAFADSGCEKKILDTGMVVIKEDAKIVCSKNPSPQAQDCMLELLTKGKGRLRNEDFFEVYGLCKVDSSEGLRACVLKRLDKPWNDPHYEGIHLIGDKCLAEKRGVKVRRYPTKQELDEQAKKRWDKEHPARK